MNPAQFRLLTAMLADEPDLFVVGDPNQSVYGFNGADPTLLDRLPEILRGTRVIRLDENHRCTPQVVAVATAVLREGGATATTGEMVAAAHDAGRRAGAQGHGPRHRRRRGGVGRRSGRSCRARRGGAGRASPCWPAPTPSWPGAGGHGRGPRAVPGGRVGPRPGAATCAPTADRRGRRRRHERRTPRRGRGPGRPRPRRAHDVPPGQGPAVADRHGPRAHRRADADRLGADRPTRSTRSGDCSTWR